MLKKRKWKCSSCGKTLRIMDISMLGYGTTVYCYSALCRNVGEAVAREKLEESRNKILEELKSLNDEEKAFANLVLGLMKEPIVFYYSSPK